jgi:hypothetical protein
MSSITKKGNKVGKKTVAKDDNNKKLKDILQQAESSDQADPVAQKLAAGLNENYHIKKEEVSSFKGAITLVNLSQNASSSPGSAAPENQAAQETTDPAEFTNVPRSTLPPEIVWLSLSLLASVGHLPMPYRRTLTQITLIKPSKTQSKRQRVMQTEGTTRAARATQRAGATAASRTTQTIQTQTSIPMRWKISGVLLPREKRG